MPKRFTDTDLWKNQRWFRKLSYKNKISFFYIKDRCNHAGLWKIDCNDLMEDIGFDSFDLKDFIDSINTEYDGITGNKVLRDRILLVKNNHLWITGFLQFQYEGKDKKVSWKGGPAYTALMQLDSFGLINEGLSKGYITLKEPLLEGWQTLKEKEEVRDKDSLTNKKNKNGKIISRNFKAQGEELLAERIARGGRVVANGEENY